mgnify:CR=1 FL=1
MASLTLRANVARPLTNDEIDNNFSNLLFFHGNKSADQHTHYLDLMLK